MSGERGRNVDREGGEDISHTWMKDFSGVRRDVHVLEQLNFVSAVLQTQTRQKSS